VGLTVSTLPAGGRFTSLVDALAAAARAHPDRDALITTAGRVSYGELYEEIERLALRLRRCRMSRSDKVLLLLPDSQEAIRVIFAVMSVGAVAVPLNPRIGARELRLVLQHLQPQFLITLRWLNDSEIGRVMRTLVGREVPTPAVLFVDTKSPIRGGGEHDLLSGNQTEVDAAQSRDEKDVATIFYTTGTTGTPKGVTHTHTALIAAVESMEELQSAFFSRHVATTTARIATLIWRYGPRLRHGIGQQVWLSPLPLHTMAGFRFALQALLGGHSLALMEGFHPDRMFDVVARTGVNVLALTPSMLQIALDAADLRTWDLSSLLVIGLGGAPVAPDIVRSARKVFGCAVVVGYGLTETAGGLSATRMEDSEREQAETVGRAFPGVDVRIVDDLHRDVPVGTVGELACRAPGIMAGYYNPPASNADAVADDGWYYTGDLATMDRRGLVRIVGRRRDLIIRGGYNIVPAEVEAVLNDHPAVKEAAVVGIRHRAIGEAVWAFVVPAPGLKLNIAELRSHCARELAPEKRPNRYQTVAELPKADTGEVHKATLRESARFAASGRE
jgi:fatty-acyl-CoA synthase